MSTIQEIAVADVLHERLRQDDKWKEQNHDPYTYLAILIEEVGEIGKAILEHYFEGAEPTKIREEVVHACAVALAMIECLDRDNWMWGNMGRTR